MTNTAATQFRDSGPRLLASVAGVSGYGPPVLAGPIDLRLDANEGPGVAGVDVGEAFTVEQLRRYPSTRALEADLATRHGVAPDQVLVTAGGDEAIDRLCRVCLDRERTAIVPVPTFEMIARSARLLGARVINVPWIGSTFPRQAVCDAVTASTGMVALVSPNNPTGAIATVDDISAVAAAAPHAMVLVDLAYVEFADVDPTREVLAMPNTLVIRTFSKAAGLAGLRVGYAIGPARVIAAMRSIGLPYSVSGPSVAVVRRVLPVLAERTRPLVARAREERRTLSELLTSVGCTPRPSQGNFVLAESSRAEWLWRALGALGIAVRFFNSAPGLERAVRITCPGEPSSFDRLCAGLCASLRPQALLLDMDGVIADVGQSYRQAIVLTAQTFGCTATLRDVAAIKAAGNANNDWVVTQRLLEARGVDADLAEVTRRFEAIYLGDKRAPGLWRTERMIPSRVELERLASRLPLAIVTGRPRRDCERFLDTFGLADLFPVRVCMEEAPAKPSPAPLRLALDRLGVSAAWMIGDTPDDIAAARAAGVVGVGFVPPNADASVAIALAHSGAAAVLDSFASIEELMP